MPGAEALLSETFKAAITGDSITGREVRRRVVDFAPVAQHIFCANTLPATTGGLDPGVIRRLLVVGFNRRIPESEQIENLGQRIAGEEADALLAWAVEGAADLLATGAFVAPASSEKLLLEWARLADSVAGFADVGVTPKSGGFLSTRKAYDSFRLWANEEGIDPRRLPTRTVFRERLSTVLGQRVIHRNAGFGWVGYGLTRPSDGPGDRK
jgi:phage/plasmid-associated DNA primase